MMTPSTCSCAIAPNTRRYSSAWIGLSIGGPRREMPHCGAVCRARTEEPHLRCRRDSFAQDLHTLAPDVGPSLHTDSSDVSSRPGDISHDAKRNRVGHEGHAYLVRFRFARPFKAFFGQCPISGGRLHRRCTLFPINPCRFPKVCLL